MSLIPYQFGLAACLFAVAVLLVIAWGLGFLAGRSRRTEVRAGTWVQREPRTYRTVPVDLLPAPRVLALVKDKKKTGAELYKEGIQRNHWIVS